MNLYIDCEFDGFKGDLISIALVPELGSHFYEVLKDDAKDLWVQENVIPILDQPKISKKDFEQKLSNYLRGFGELTIIADYPADIMYFCQVLLVAPLISLNVPDFTAKVITGVPSYPSNPHNALSDAYANKDALNGRS